MVIETLKNFPKQFLWEPEIENKSSLVAKPNIIVLGMGGSHLAADALKTWTPYAEKITIHSDYGLPSVNLNNSLIVAFSHSGNTEEVIDGFNEAKSKNIPIIGVSTGGRLGELARLNFLPFILLPDPATQPRFATGYHFRALLKIMGEEKILNETKNLSQTLNTGRLEKEGLDLAQKIEGKIPVIYSSTKKAAVAQNWKIKFNETAKVPSFCNFLPELNHNEMVGFDFTEESKALSEKFFFILLEDKYDHPKNQKRMLALFEWLKEKKLPCFKVLMEGSDHWHKIFSDMLLADFTSLAIAEKYNRDPEKVAVAEEFKKTISGN